MTRVVVVDVPGWRERFDDESDAIRHFDAIVAEVENVVPLVHVLGLGRLAVAARGPARYYGSESDAAMALRAVHPDARVGIADGLFTAVIAARSARPVVIVPESRSPEFLEPLSVVNLEDDELVTLLRRLGITTLGGFVALGESAVRDRFGGRGGQLWRLAGGLDDSPIVPRDIPIDYSITRDFEPAIVRADELAFALRQTAEEFIDALVPAGLVCTALWVTLTTERGDEHERCWAHPTVFRATDVVDRVRWQVESIARLTTDTSTEGFAGGGIVRVRIAPDQLAPHRRFERGLWDEPTSDRIQSVLARVQSILGHEGVLRATVGGGRFLAEREVLTPWGDRPVVAHDPSQPWPGRLPDHLPTTVYRDGARIELRGSGVIGPAAILTEPPQWIVYGTKRREVVAWSGPWPLHERWWDGGSIRYRLQAVDAQGAAWVLLSDGPEWTIEARYD